MKILSMIIQMIAIEQYFPVALFGFDCSLEDGHYFSLNF